jgi:arginase family enzyme
LHAQIINLDDSVTSQPAFANAPTIDARDLGVRVRLWSRRTNIERLRARFDEAHVGIESTVTLLGSGDFHHVATLLHERVREPFTLVHFDNHPDWVRLAPRWHCGAWINRALELPNIARVVTLGPCSDDLVDPGRKGGNLPALESGKLVLFPWRHAPSRVWHRVADGAGHYYADGRVHWRNLCESPLDEALSAALAAMATDAVWISIDKDVLAENEVVTNWDQGEMPLDALLAFVRGIARAKRVIGADICGEYAPIAHANLFKRIESRLDQPDRTVDAARLAANERVNVALVDALGGAAARC